MSSEPRFEFERKPGVWRLSCSGGAAWGVSLGFGMVIALVVVIIVMRQLSGH
jgi:hypothetical protein